MRREIKFAGIIFLITLAVFLPALSNGFVDWDDTTYILANPHIRGLNWENFRWMLTSFYLVHYIPVTWFSLALDYFFWGYNPAGYHAVNLALHALNAVL